MKSNLDDLAVCRGASLRAERGSCGLNNNGRPIIIDKL